MNVLFITTPPNCVHDALVRATGVSVDYVDCNEFMSRKHRFFSELQRMVDERHYQILLTYRCPYLIPASIRGRVEVCLNIHPLSLPEFSGLNPWDKFRLAGRNDSEAVVHLMEDDADRGAVVARWPYSFEDIGVARSVADRVIAGNILSLVLKMSCVHKWCDQ